ncbi:ABC transporter substrate-binding protein [Microseira sp. BLCC-F43]|uniref:ABC transporter substrate-binding protein n=1 Tax=Microseira sp. BLCC-F43 TaxID=3153602 RepID=UPI0035B8C106
MHRPQLEKRAVALALTTLTTGLLVTACQTTTTTPPSATSPAPASPVAATPTTAATPAGGEGGLKIGSLLPSTGDLASIGQAMVASVPMAVETANKCGGVNGKPVTLVAEDDQTNPAAGAATMTKLAEVDKVAGVVGSFASSVSSAAVDIAVRNKVMLVSPGSTSPVFTERAKKGEFQGFWARTAPPDTYQAAALANLAKEKGFKRVSTVVINNDYGVGFEKAFVEAFEKQGGTVVNKAKPTRYDPKATTFDTEAAAAFAGKPDGVVAVLYAETGSIFLKSAFQQGVSQGVTVMLTDGVYSPTFPEQVGKTGDGKFILAGAVGTTPGADGKALTEFAKLWKEKQGRAVDAYAPQTWDATALLMLAAEAAKSNTGEGIKSKIREVANAPGEEVSDVCKALELVRQGKDINYQGASGNVDIDQNGDVVGSYDVWKVEPTGKLSVTGKVSPK